MGAAVAPPLERLPAPQGEEPQELPASSANLRQRELPGPLGSESENQGTSAEG